MSSISDHILDSPLNRKVYVPGDDESTSAPVTYPKNAAETDQTHRRMDWLHHNPQDHVIFPIATQAVKIEKKKP